MKNKIIVSIIVFSICIFANSCNYAPGSYPFAEVYTVNAKDSTVIKAVNWFKQRYPEYKVPPVTIDGKSYFPLADHLTKEGIWYLAYFYIKDRNEIIGIYIRSRNSRSTNLGFIGVNRGLTLGNWTEINDGFDRKENKRQIEQFEKLILNPIKSELEKGSE